MLINIHTRRFNPTGSSTQRLSTFSSYNVYKTMLDNIALTLRGNSEVIGSHGGIRNDGEIYPQGPHEAKVPLQSEGQHRLDFFCLNDERLGKLHAAVRTVAGCHDDAHF